MAVSSSPDGLVDNNNVAYDHCNNTLNCFYTNARSILNNFKVDE